MSFKLGKLISYIIFLLLPTSVPALMQIFNYRNVSALTDIYKQKRQNKCCLFKINNKNTLRLFLPDQFHAALHESRQGRSGKHVLGQ